MKGIDSEKLWELLRSLSREGLLIPRCELYPSDGVVDFLMGKGHTPEYIGVEGKFVHWPQILLGMVPSSYPNYDELARAIATADS